MSHDQLQKQPFHQSTDTGDIKTVGAEGEERESTAIYYTGCPLEIYASKGILLLHNFHGRSTYPSPGLLIHYNGGQKGHRAQCGL